MILARGRKRRSFLQNIGWLAAIVAAAALRLPGVGAGLPYSDYVDEG